jgi:Cdc6-like AAA superfamily ATPase
LPTANNPFTPNRPIYSGVFAGRLNEIIRINTVFEETRSGNPTNLLIIGERGIGKTSLLLLAMFLSRGDIEWDGVKYDFLPMYLTLDARKSIGQLATTINGLVERALRHLKATPQILKDIWQFIQRVEVAGTKIAPSYKEISEAEIFDRFVYSLVDTAKSITDPATAISKLNLAKPKDGLVIFIDEADKASPALDLGTLLKQITESLVAEDCNRVVFILSGLPYVRKVLVDSHPSSLRLFEELELFPLSEEEVRIVIQKGLDEANKRNTIPIKITSEALNAIYSFSEGYPHFVQQFGYCCYSYDTDNVIDENDVTVSAFSDGGAFDLIGDRYYKDLYFNKIREDAYRQILKIMSQKWNQWISKKEIWEKFKGKKTTFDNGLAALATRGIILRRPGAKGEYRLQWAGFAFWINHFAERKERDIAQYNSNK